MTETSNKIFFLIGPKGAGKTNLAQRMENELGIPHLNVEPIWLALSSEMDTGSRAFSDEGQRRVLAQVRNLLDSSSRIVLDSTGTAPWFFDFLARLGEMGSVVLVSVCAPPSLCLERIHCRDASQQIAASDEWIAEINKIATGLELPWTAVVENVSTEVADAFIEKVRQGGLG